MAQKGGHAQVTVPKAALGPARPHRGRRAQPICLYVVNPDPKQRWPGGGKQGKERPLCEMQLSISQSEPRITQRHGSAFHFLRATLRASVTSSVKCRSCTRQKGTEVQWGECLLGLCDPPWNTGTAASRGAQAHTSLAWNVNETREGERGREL